MIHTFNKKRKQLFFPTNWANSVSAWCLGVCSPNGTLTIGNTATPTEGGESLKLDINEARLQFLFDKRMASRNWLSYSEREGIKTIIGQSVDQKCLKWTDGLLTLDMETLAKELPTADIPRLQPNAAVGDNPDFNTDAKVAAAAPKAIEAVLQEDGGADETDEHKILRIGKSLYAAREDHIHPFEHATGANENLKKGTTDGDAIPSGATYARDTQSWTRDSTGTLDSSGGQTSEAYNGVSVLVVSRIERMAGTGLDVLYLRTATFDKNGCLYNVSEESTKCFIHFNNT